MPDSPVTPQRGSAEALQPAFVDSPSAKRWAAGLDLMPVQNRYVALIGQLEALGDPELSPRDRLIYAEILREPVARLHTELARRYAGKPQPAPDREREAFGQAVAMWQALLEAYSACLKRLLEGDPDLQAVKAKLLYRGLHTVKELILVHALAHRLPPASLWHELHAYYRLAEMLDCVVQAVSDELLPDAVGVSCYSIYSHALLLSLADPCAMSIRQIEMTDRWLQRWARKLFPYTLQRETEGPTLVVDLDSGTGASVVDAPPSDGPPSMRYGYTSRIATSVRGRLKRLAAGTSPSELRLGGEVTTEQGMSLLAALDARWNHPSRRGGPGRTMTLSVCAGGLAAAYFRVSGRTFERQDRSSRYSYQGSQQIATLDVVSDYDRHRETAERNFAWEDWSGTLDGRDISMVRAASDLQHRWTLDQLAMVHEPGQPARLGSVSRVALSDAELAISIRLFPGLPRALALQPTSALFSEEPSIPAIEIDATEEARAQLIVPPRTFNPGRIVRTVDVVPERRLRLTRLLARGTDYERVAFDIAN